MLSNISLQPGTKVVWLLLEQNPYDFNTVTTKCFWFARSAPLFGEYDDYGQASFEPGQEGIIAAIEKQFKFDGNVGDEFSFDTLIESFYDQQSVTVNSDSHTDRPVKQLLVKPVMINRDVWDMFLEQTFNADSKYGHVFSKYELQVANYLNTMEEKRKSIVAGVKFNELMLDLYDSYSENDYRMSFSPGFGNEVPFTGNNTYIVRTYERAFLKGELSFEEFSMFHNRLSQLQYVNTIMSLNRMFWHPTSGSGSQTEAFELSANIHMNIAKISLSLFEESVKDSEYWSEDPVADRIRLNALKALFSV